MPALSKVKRRKQAERLEYRQRQYDALSSDLKREQGGSFTRPGSNKK